MTTRWESLTRSPDLPIFATLRIKSGKPGVTRPDESRLYEAESRLRDQGFEVLYKGHDTLDVEVSEQNFERALGVPCPGPEGMSAFVSPPDSALRRLVDLVEVFPPVVHLAR